MSNRVNIPQQEPASNPASPVTPSPAQQPATNPAYRDSDSGNSGNFTPFHRREKE
jgi:hypothetical protein